MMKMMENGEWSNIILKFEEFNKNIIISAIRLNKAIAI